MVRLFREYAECVVGAGASLVRCVYGKCAGVMCCGVNGQLFGHVWVRYFWTYRVHVFLKNVQRLGESGQVGQVSLF